MHALVQPKSPERVAAKKYSKKRETHRDTASYSTNNTGTFPESTSSSKMQPLSSSEARLPFVFMPPPIFYTHGTAQRNFYYHTPDGTSHAVPMPWSPPDAASTSKLMVQNSVSSTFEEMASSMTKNPKREPSQEPSSFPSCAPAPTNSKVGNSTPNLAASTSTKRKTQGDPPGQAFPSDIRSFSSPSMRTHFFKSSPSSAATSSPSSAATSSPSSAATSSPSSAASSTPSSSATSSPTKTNPTIAHRRDISHATLPTAAFRIVGAARELVSSSEPQSDQTGLTPAGRLSNETMEQLVEGFGELDRVVQNIKVSTGLTATQIMKRWQPSSPRQLNFWNIYQKYFQTRMEEELSRVQMEDRIFIENKPSIATIRTAYKIFRENEPNHESILETFWRIHQIDGSNTTLNARHRDFVKFVNAVKRLAESASTVNGFEIAFCAVGSVVHQDQSLSTTYCSPMISNFFSDRLHLADNEIEGHLKAHVYDFVSRTTLSKTDSTEVVASSPASPTQSSPSKNEHGSQGSTTRNRTLLSVLKTKFVELLGPCKIARLQMSRLPFSDMPAILAENGYVMENWPEDIPFPCDLPKGRGIAGLQASYREPLLKALDHKSYPLRVVKKYSEAVPASEPVIIGIPPAPQSPYARARRRFLDECQTVDRNGPARRAGLSEIQRNKRSEVCDGHQSHHTPPKKRRKGEGEGEHAQTTHRATLK